MLKTDVFVWLTVNWVLIILFISYVTYFNSWANVFHSNQRAFFKFWQEPEPRRYVFFLFYWKYFINIVNALAVTCHITLILQVYIYFLHFLNFLYVNHMFISDMSYHILSYCNIVLRKLVSFTSFNLDCFCKIWKSSSSSSFFFFESKTFSKYRSSHHRCSIKIVVFKKFAIFTGKHLSWSLF